jgi:hypothetical protein
LSAPAEFVQPTAAQGLLTPADKYFDLRTGLTHSRIDWDTLKPPKWWRAEVGDRWEWDPAWFQLPTRGPIVPTCPSSVTLTDAGGYRHWFNPLFEGLPWLIDVPMVASEWIGFVAEGAEYRLAEWMIKYGKQHNQPKDQNLNCTIRFSASKMSHAWSVNSATKRFQKDLSGKDGEYDTARPVKRKSTDTYVGCTAATRHRDYQFDEIVQKEPRFTRDGLSNWTMIEVEDGTPEHFTPGEDCFSEAPRPREDVGWRVEGKGIHSRCVPALPGGRGGAGAKTQIKEKDFVPAELPSESELQFWEDKINASIDDYKREREVFRFDHPDDVYSYDRGQPIVRQDRHGNLVGQHFNTVKRTTTSALQRRQDIDKRMKLKVIQRRMEAGENTKKLELEKIVMRTYFGNTAAEVGKIVGKGRKAVQKIKERIGPKKKSWSGVDRAIEGMMDRGDRGWFIVVKLPFRSAYLCRLNILETATAEEIDEAVNLGLVEEATRMWSDELVRIGRNKMTNETGDFTEEAKVRMKEIHDRVRKAFKGGHVVGHFFCEGPGTCEICSPRPVESPSAAKEDGEWMTGTLGGRKIARTVIHTYGIES